MLNRTRRAEALALGCVWSPPALWCVVPGKGTGSPRVGEQAATMQGMGYPMGCPIAAAPDKKGDISQVAIVAAWYVTGHSTHAHVQR